MLDRNVRCALVLALVLPVGCEDLPTRPSAQAPQVAASGPNVVVSASGGARWDLGGLDLDGDGADDPVGNVLAFNAVRKADGSVGGQIEYQQSALGETFRFHGTVTCIDVYEGNRGRFGGPITFSDDPTVPVGLFMWFTVVDNGAGSSGTPDRSSILGLGDHEANERFCANPNPPNPRFSANIESGDIRVLDNR